MTPIEYMGLQAAYDHFNGLLFGGALPDVFITGKSGSVSTRNAQPSASAANKDAEENLHDVAARLPALTKIVRDLEYRLPESGRPLGNVALTREQCIELLQKLRASSPEASPQLPALTKIAGDLECRVPGSSRI